MASIFELLAQNQPSFQTHQALIAIGLQNDFCSPVGKLPVSKPDGLLHRVKKIIPAFRDHAGSIIWVRTEADPAQPASDGSDDADAVITSVPGKPSSGHDDGSLGLTAAELQPSDSPSPRSYRSHRSRRRPADLLRRVTARNQEDEIDAPVDTSLEEELFLANDSGVCLAGTHGAAFADDIAPEIRPGDIVVTKRWYSALRGTTLLLTLRTRLITELFVCGCISNISVYATAAEAARHGITIYLIDDCIGYRKLDRHQEAMKQMVEYMGAYLISFDDAMKKITGNSQGETSDQSTNKDGATANDEHDIGDMLKKLNIKDTPGSGNASRQQPAQHGDKDEPTLEKSSLGNHESNPPRVRRSSSSTKSHVRMRRRTDTSKSEQSSSANNQDLKGTSSSQASPAAQSTSAISSSSCSQNTSPRTSATGAPIFPNSRNNRPPDMKDTGPFPRSPSSPRRILKDGERPVKSKVPAALPTLGAADTIGEGDSRLVLDFLSDQVNAPGTTRPFQESIFDRLVTEVWFQKMLHATGDVPRLVAVQGDVGPDGSMPIYRHPSDQSLPLMHFSPSVLLLRRHVERLVQHPMNHVLIQFYRQGADHISEHSDKTLDIVRGSKIVNVSFGAQRTMRLRTKRSANPNYEGETISNSREIQRVAMPHNSALVIGPATNTRWLHGIMPDKRPSSEKGLPETSFMGMRISLTFRRIGTFLSSDSRFIWGQGASSKHKARAAAVVNGDAKATESIIRAFSAENQQTSETFDWDLNYGGGFDMLHFTIAPPDPDPPILFLSMNAPGNRAVQLYLQELDIIYNTVKAGTPISSDLTAENSSTFLKSPPVLFRDNDTLHTEVSDTISILAYLERFYSRNCQGPSTSPQAKHNVALSQQYLDLANHLFRAWDHGLQTKWKTQAAVDDVSRLLARIETLIIAESERRQRQRGDSPNDEGELPCLVGSSVSAPDCAVWACYERVRADEHWESRGVAALEDFWKALQSRFDGGATESGRDKARHDHGDLGKVLDDDASQATSAGGAKEKERKKENASASRVSPSSPPSAASSSASASASPDKASRKEKARRK